MYIVPYLEKERGAEGHTLISGVPREGYCFLTGVGVDGGVDGVRGVDGVTS